jgi:hypothetical protein
MNLRALAIIKKVATEPDGLAGLSAEERTLLLVECRSMIGTLTSMAQPSEPAPQTSERSSPPRAPELTPADVAARLQVEVRYVYRHASSWPFTRRISKKVLRFSEAGFNRWLEERGREP